MLNHEINKTDNLNLLVSRSKTCDSVAIITLNRPTLRNTLSIDTIQELTETFLELSQSPKTSVVVLRGLGEAFAAGADIKELLKLTETSAVDFSLLGGNLFRAISNSPSLVIAAIDGFCMGGGLDLALSCDLRYGSNQAIFAHPGANIGIITGFGGTYRLPKTVGKNKADQLFATAQRINASQALEMGLIQALATNSTAYDLAIEKATQMAKFGKDFISHIKKLTSLASKTSFPKSKTLLNYYHQLQILD
ncbi:MAG: enoyl-CoA hydratase/isomerase family protein [Acidobacteria bacterium]|nr:enoyl-CoA hydratase/isomerase family protein [Acidobacteriota bacterium]